MVQDDRGAPAEIAGSRPRTGHESRRYGTIPPGVSYKVRHLNGVAKIDVRASDGTARVFWSWSLSADRDPREFLETVAYPAIRRFMAANGTRGR